MKMCCVYNVYVAATVVAAAARAVACIYCRIFPLFRQFSLLFVIYYPRNVGRTDILTGHENQFAMRQIVYLLSVL